jgi:hypothetical protein
MGKWKRRRGGMTVEIIVANDILVWIVEGLSLTLDFVSAFYVLLHLSPLPFSQELLVLVLICCLWPAIVEILGVLLSIA